MPDLLARRSVVTLVAILSLVGAVAAVRVANAWTASNAPLVVKPIDAQALAERLAAEQIRSASLRTQLATIATQATKLTDALRNAQREVKADAANAAALAKQLAAANAKVTALQAQGAAGANSASSQSAAAPSPTPVPGAGSGEGGGTDD